MMGDWTFFSNYGHVLVCLARNREARLRDVAVEVGITERAVQKIVRDLQDAGYLAVTKQGRCNRYKINSRKSLRHDLESHCTVGKLLSLISKSREAPAKVKAKVIVEDQPGESAEATEVVQSPPQAEVTSEPVKPDKPVDTREQGSLF